MSAVIAPLFGILPVAWQPPFPARIDCVIFTSANAPRHGGSQLRQLTHLPCFVVGEATAVAARQAGFGDVRTGPRDGASLMEMVRQSSFEAPVHLCGKDHVELAPGLLRRVVYAAEPVPALPAEASAALSRGAVALVHSRRAGSLFGKLVDEAGFDRGRILIAAISGAAAEAAGEGWKWIGSAATPRDDALLELAAKLCQTAASDTGNGE